MGSLETDDSLRASERPLQDISPDREQRADGLRSVNPYSTGKPGTGSDVDDVQLSRPPMLGPCMPAVSFVAEVDRLEPFFLRTLPADLDIAEPRLVAMIL